MNAKLKQILLGASTVMVLYPSHQNIKIGNGMRSDMENIGGDFRRAINNIDVSQVSQVQHVTAAS